MPSRKRRQEREGVFSGHRAQRAIIDIGSNTVRLVIYGGSARAPTVLFNEKMLARLGRDISTKGTLADEAVELALRGLRRFSVLLQDHDITDVEVVATAAVRDASNGPDFLAQVRAIGFDPRLLSGEEEAATSAIGVIGAFPGAEGVVADLGGGSLEFTRIGNGMCETGTSLPLGTLRLHEWRETKPSAMRKSIGKLLDKEGWGGGIDAPLYLVGGTWRAMAVYAMQQRGYPLTDPHGFELTAKEAVKLGEELAAADPEELRKLPRISTMRASYLPDTAVLLQALVEQLTPEKLVISAWGLREGLLYQRLDPVAQAQDPLLAGMAQFAAQRGAPPMLATRVAGWTVDAVPESGKGSERLRLAATLDLPPGAVFRLVELPMLARIAPGAFVVVFALCLSSFAVALTLGGGPRATTVELAIYQSFRFDFDLAHAATLALVQLLLVAGAALVLLRLPLGAAQAGLDQALRRRDADRAGMRALDAGWIALAALFLLLPLAAIALRGLPGLAELGAPVWQAAAVSLAVALGSTALCLALALPLAMGRGELAGLLGLAVSPLVLGTGLFLLIRPFAAPFALALPVTALVNALMALPFALRALRPEVQAITATYGPLAQALGMGPRAWTFRVLLPRLRRPLGFSAGLTAALSMGDLGVIALFAPDRATLPLQMYRLMQGYRMEAASAAALLLLALSLGLFWIFDRGGRADADA
ncbi:MAG: hypothetical protein KDE15_12550 [Erythrobacter sp.]|nr:hypothetical protein [Erythrobacter sp.]